LNKNRKRKFGDRYDGWKVRSLDLFFPLIPHILRSRLDCQVQFEEEVEIAALEKFVRKLRKETEMTDLSLFHVVVAAAMRMISQKPSINRFVSGRKIYARNDLSLVMSVKKELTLDGEETSIKAHFEPTDALGEIWRKLSDEITVSKRGETNSTDATAKIVTLLPGFLMKFVVWLLRNMDHLGIMPKFINSVSPFHCSMVLTDMGSTGIDAVYHHLYEFGTCSLFMAMGKKKTVVKQRSDGTIGTVRVISLKFTVDERICDGFYYASAIRQFKKLLRHPELLLTPPESVPEDPGLPKEK